MCLYERGLHQQQPAPVSAQHRQHLIRKGEKRACHATRHGPRLYFLFFYNRILSLNVTIFQAFPAKRKIKSKGEEHMYTRGSVKVGAEAGLGMLYEYQLAYASVPQYPCILFHKYPLGTNLYVCFCLHAKASHRHVLLMIFRFSLVSPLLGSLTLSNCRSLLWHLYLSLYLPLQSTHHRHLLPFIIFHYIHSQVCVQKCPCSHPPPLLPCLYLFLILFYRFLSSPLLIATHCDRINQLCFSPPGQTSSLLSSMET